MSVLGDNPYCLRSFSGIFWQAAKGGIVDCILSQFFGF